MEPTSLRFARAARSLATAAQARGLRAPTFRSPPRVAGVTRTLRRSPGAGGSADGAGQAGDVTVSVVLRGRPWAAVAADMVDGVVAANRLAGVDADRARAALWAAVADLGERAA
jgi:hypothetical protein